MYSILLFDNNGSKLGRIDKLIDPAFNKGLNKAGEVSFRVPASALSISRLNLARKFTLFYGANREPICSGMVDARDLEKSPYSFQCVTNEVKLASMTTPTDWKYYNGRKVHEAVEDLLEDFEIIRVNTKNDFTLLPEQLEGLQYITDEQHTFKPMLALAQDSKNAFVSNGLCQWVIDVTRFSRIDRLRFAQEVGEKTYITMQYQVSYDNKSTWTNWIGPLGKNDSAKFPSETGYVINLKGASHIRTRFTLYTEDTTSKAYSDDELKKDPTLKQFYGVTPLFLGFELVCRKPGPVKVGFIAQSDKIIKDFDLNETNHHLALTNLAEQYGYEFYVSAKDELFWLQTVGEDLSEKVKIVSSRNCNITKLGDGLNGVENFIRCFGKWDGIGQVFTTVQDDESIKAFGIRPGRHNDETAETVEQLKASGNNYLAKKAWPQMSLEVAMRMPKSKHLKPGDIVTVIIPGSRIKLKSKIISCSTSTDPEGNVATTLELNSPRKSILDDVYENRQRIEEVDRKIKETQNRVDIVERGANDTPAQPSPPMVTLLYKPDRTPYVKIEWVQVRQNTNGTRAEDIAGYRVIKSTSENLTNPQTIEHSRSYDLMEIDYNIKEREIWWYAIQAYDKFGNTSAISSPEDVLIKDQAPPANIISVTGQGYIDTVLAMLIYPDDSAVTGAELYYIPQDAIRNNIAAGQANFPVQINDLVYRTDARIDRAIFPANCNGYIYAKAVSQTGVLSEGYAVSDLIDLTNTSHVHVIQEQGAMMLRAILMDQQGKKISEASLIIDSLDGGRIVLDAREVIANGSITTELLKAGSITADKYNELRQSMPINFSDSLDADHPLIVDFILPSETTRLVSVKVSLKGMPFRSYSKAVQAGGGHNHEVVLPPHKHSISFIEQNFHTQRSTTGITIQESPTHTHTFSGSGSGGISVGDHQHSYGDADFTASAGSFSRTVSISISGTTGGNGKHTHTIKEPLVSDGAGGYDEGHEHLTPGIPIAANATENEQTTIRTQVTAIDHIHPLQPGIYEATTPKDVKIICSDDGLTFNDLNYIIAPNNAPNEYTPYVIGKEIDLTNKFSILRNVQGVITNPFKALKITSSRLGRISGVLMVKVDISA